MLGILMLSTAAWPCSGVGPAGKPVVFGDQTNIVIWDEANQTEHFIRNANFRSGATDFGFIAPTPGSPTLSEASTKAFYTLANLAPSILSGSAGGGFGGAGRTTLSAEVKVIQEADVSGYHATTLWSKDAHAINNWMNDHGYVSTPEVEQWAERYCSRGWYLTAFKVVDRTKLAASTGTVRMTFHTRKPYNPFYVPSSNIPVTRPGTLRVYFVSVGDYQAKIGVDEIWQSPQWTAPIPTTTADQLTEEVKLPKGSIPEHAQVETFVDPNFPRPAPEDIYFTKKQPLVQPKENFDAPTRVVPPSAVPMLAGFGVLALVTRRRLLG